MDILILILALVMSRWIWNFIRKRRCPNCKKFTDARIIAKDFLQKGIDIFGSCSEYRVVLQCRNCKEKWTITDKETDESII